MASNISSTFEVILYPTRATRSTTAFSRATMGSFPLLHRPDSKTGKFRLSVSWGEEEAFSIPSLPIVSVANRQQPSIRNTRVVLLTAQLAPSNG